MAYKLATVKGQFDALLNQPMLDQISAAMQQAMGDRINNHETERLAKYHLSMLAREVMDVFFLEKLQAPTLNQFIALNGLEHYVAAKASGKPVILYTAHFGRLIMPAIALGIQGFPTSALTAPVFEHADISPASFNYLRYKLAQMQKIMQGDLVSAAESMRHLYKILQRGETLIVLIDVAPTPGQPYYEADFINGTARFPKGIVKLALKTGALLVPYFTTEQSGQLTGEFLPALDTAVNDEAALLKNILAPVQDKILQYPEQWWMWPWLNAFWNKQ